HRLRHEHLRRPCECRNPRADRDGEPTDLAVDDRAFADVDAGTDLEPEISDTGADIERTSDSTSRPVERRIEPIAGCIDLGAVPTSDLPSHRGVMPLQERLPSCVT